MDVVRLFGLLIAFLISTMLVMAIADDRESKAESAKLVHSMCGAFGSDARYVLMLRSFDSRLIAEKIERVTVVEREETRAVRGSIDRLPTGRKYKDYEHQTLRADDVIAFIVSSTSDLPVVIIDGNSQNLSAAPFSVLSTDKQWWPAFKVLAQGAYLIAVVPEASLSLLDEMKWVVAQYREKTVFLMPPSMQQENETPDTWLSGMTRRERWEEIIGQLPVELPDYTERGAIVRLPDRHSEPVCNPYERETIEGLARERRPGGASIRAALAQLQAQDLLAPLVDELEQRAVQLMGQRSR
jgi:hypothetical protein